MNPWRSDYHAELGLVYFDDGNWTAAAAACRDALRLRASWVEVRKRLVQCYLHLGNTEAALSEHETVRAFRIPLSLIQDLGRDGWRSDLQARRRSIHTLIPASDAIQAITSDEGSGTLAFASSQSPFEPPFPPAEISTKLSRPEVRIVATGMPPADAWMTPESRIAPVSDVADPPVTASGPSGAIAE